MKWAISIVATLILLLLDYVMPFDGLDAMSKHALIIFLSAIVFWIFRPLPEYLSAIIAGAALIICAKAPAGLVLSGFSSAVWWMVLFAMILGVTINHTGLGKRLAYTLVKKFGRGNLKMMYVTTMANNILAPFTPSNTARGALTCGVVESLCDSLGYKPGENKGDHTLMMGNMFINTTNTFMFLTAMGGNMLCVKIISEMTGRTVTWMDWFIAGFFPGIPLLLLVPYIVYKLFPMAPMPVEDCTAMACKQLDEMGPMSRAEKHTAIIMGITLLLWATQSLHGLSATKTSFVLAALLLPKIGAVNYEEIGPKVPWPALIWLGFAMGMANLINKFGGFKWLVETLLAGNSVMAHLSFGSFLAILIPTIIFMHFMFAGMNAMILIVLPITITLAQKFGFDPYVVGLISSMALSVGAFFMPFNSAPNLIFYGTGRYTVIQQLKGAVPLAILASLVLILALHLWWPLVGIL